MDGAMNGSSDKKWFVYVEDHHEGPFTSAEVQQKVQQGSVRSDQFVWSEGMQDWKAMAEVPEFVGLVGPAPVAESSGSGLEMSLQNLVNQAPPPPAGAVQTNISSAPFSPSAVSLEDPHMVNTAPIEASRADVEIPSSQEQLGSQAGSEINVSQSKDLTGERKTPLKANPALYAQDAMYAQGGMSVRGGPNKFKRFLKMFLLLAVLGGGAWAYTQGYLDTVLKNPALQQGIDMVKTASGPALSFISEKVPFLAPYLSPLPQLKDVSPADYDELKTAAVASLSSLGPQAAIAPVTGGVVQFYVASNLPDDTTLTLRLEGIDSTLLNVLEFKNDVSLTLKNHLAQTPNLSKVKGQPLPKGEYNLYIYEADQQPPAVKAVFDGLKPVSGSRFPRELGAKKVAVTKRLFLGGTKDKTYQDRLAEYHEKVKVRAQQDKEELNQVIQTLMNQYNASRLLFNTSKAKVDQKTAQVKSKKKGMDPAIKKGFNDKAAKWAKFQAEINKFDRWTPEYLQASFYPQVYDRVKKASGLLIAMQEMQSQYFNKVVDTTSFDKQLTEAQDQAREMITDLLITMKTIEQSLTENQGLPKKIQ